MKNCNNVKIVQKTKGPFKFIRVTKIDEILNIKAIKNKKIEQILKQLKIAKFII